MYLISNRQILANETGLDQLGDKPHANGPQEINIFEVTKKAGAWVATQIPGILDSKVVKELKKTYKIDINVKEQWNGSLLVACKLFESAQQTNKSILFFVHGYNNDVEDVMAAAEAIETLYNVIVVPFTWPANGGNFVTGAASYLSDKADARQSSHALNRIIGKLGFYHRLITDARLHQFRKDIATKPPKDQAVIRRRLTELQQKKCRSNISLLCHSMGNYVLKHTLLTSDSHSNKLVFDNICLVSADVNNKNHKKWVDRLEVRNRCYIVINEADAALAASRIKFGDEQLVRLGHHVKNLESDNAYYIDVTDAKGVGSAHSYFKGDAVADNVELQALFNGMFNGRSVEKSLHFLKDKKLYILPASGLVEEESFFDGVFG